MPDVAVFTWNRIPVDENGDIANVFPVHPDWTIEILSPEQSQTKVTRNILHCLKYGSQMGWLIDPDEQTVLVFPPGKQPELLEAQQDKLPIPDWSIGFQLTVGDVFGWLRL